MIEVYETVLHDVMGPRGPQDSYEYVVPSRPEVNSNSNNQATSWGYIVDSWNRQFPDDQKSLEDFDFVPAPPDWVNPNN